MSVPWASAFFIQGECGGTAGKVEDGQNQHTYGGAQGPALTDQQRVDRGKILISGQGSLRKVPHQKNRNDDFIGGKSQ